MVNDTSAVTIIVVTIFIATFQNYRIKNNEVNSIRLLFCFVDLIRNLVGTAHV